MRLKWEFAVLAGCVAIGIAAVVLISRQTNKEFVYSSVEVFVPSESKAEMPTAPESAPTVEAAALDTIAQINHINWVVSKIKTYNNVLVLEEEYKQISPDRLNLNRIPDQKTLNKITEMLDILHSMIRDERDLSHWRRVYELRKKNAQFEFWAGQYRTVGTTVSETAWAHALLAFDPVFSLSNSVLNSYRDYTQYIQGLEGEVVQKQFEFESAQLERLHQLNKELLQSQWEMIQEYQFDDSLRVVDSDITHLIEALKDADHARVYARVEAMKDRFEIFPVYWYYLSSLALEMGHTEEALAACDAFFKVNRGLFRNDPMVASVAMNKIYLLEKNKANKTIIRDLLALVWKHNAIDVDWRKDYFAATIYATYLEDREMAEKVLQHGMAALGASLNETLQWIQEPNEEPQQFSEALEFADGEGLYLCRKLMDEIQKETKVYDEAGLRKICQDETVSNIEKMVYVGKLPSFRLWDIIGEEVVNITLEMNHTISWEGVGARCLATIPLRWFLAGKLNPKLELMEGQNVLSSHTETRKARKLMDANALVLQFDLPKDKLEKADSFSLVFQHADYPMALRFASRSAYLADKPAPVVSFVPLDIAFNASNARNDLRVMEIGFKDVVYRLDTDAKQYLKTIARADWVNLFKKTFRNLQDFKSGTYAVNRGGVERIECNDAGEVKIIYHNTATTPIRPAVSIYLLSEYGVVKARIDDMWRFKQLQPGEKAETSWLKGFPSAKYIDIEVKE